MKLSKKEEFGILVEKQYDELTIYNSYFKIEDEKQFETVIEICKQIGLIVDNEYYPGTVFRYSPISQNFSAYHEVLVGFNQVNDLTFIELLDRMKPESVRPIKELENYKKSDKLTIYNVYLDDVSRESFDNLIALCKSYGLPTNGVYKEKLYFRYSVNFGAFSVWVKHVGTKVTPEKFHELLEEHKKFASINLTAFNVVVTVTNREHLNKLLKICKDNQQPVHETTNYEKVPTFYYDEKLKTFGVGNKPRKYTIVSTEIFEELLFNLKLASNA